MRLEIPFVVWDWTERHQIKRTPDLVLRSCVYNCTGYLQANPLIMVAKRIGEKLLEFPVQTRLDSEEYRDLDKWATQLQVPRSHLLRWAWHQASYLLEEEKDRLSAEYRRAKGKNPAT